MAETHTEAKPKRAPAQRRRAAEGERPATAERREEQDGADAGAAATRREEAATARAGRNDGRKANGNAGRSAEKRNSNKRGGGMGGAFWGAAAAGVAVGVAAMIGRKVAVQAPTALAGDWDAALAAEHKGVIKVFDALQATTGKNVTSRTMLLAKLKHALAKHALQEENVVYPALRDSGQTEAADGLNRDHGYVKQYLYELDNCPRNSDQFLAIVTRFRADLEKHVHEEEDQLFPALKAQLAPEANRKLTLAMNKEGFKLA